MNIGVNIPIDYVGFVASKLVRVPVTGLTTIPDLHATLFPFQKDLVTWALRRGRAAIFCDTGLGKTRQQIEWARCVASSTRGRVLVLAPLSVAPQTVREAAEIDVQAKHARYAEDLDTGEPIVVTNYDRLHLFDPSQFQGVVLDESSIIKNHNAKTLDALMTAFAQTPFKLCATATPSPNDYTELGTHAEFLGVCSREEMLAEFFCHDGGETQKWRLKGHARTAFWRWVSGWGALLRRPSDLGYEDAGYALPPLTVQTHVIAADPEETKAAGLLFAEPALTLTERRNARRSTTTERVRLCAELVMGRSRWPGPESSTPHTRRPITIGQDLPERSLPPSSELGTTPPVAQNTQPAPISSSRRARKPKSGSVQTPSEGPSSECASTESPLPIEIGSSQNRAEDAGSAAPNSLSASPATGVTGNCTSTTATPPTLSAASSVPHATSGSASSPTIRNDSNPPLDTFVVWCELNAEQDELGRLFGDDCVSIYGADDSFTKELKIGMFLRGERRIMLTKPSIAGMGLNLQFCRRMAFVGVTDSFERTYQAIRRCWRYGQKHPVDVHFFASELEGAVVENYQRKERDAVAMAEQLSIETREAVKAEVFGSSRQTNTYSPARIAMPPWLTTKAAE